MTIYVHAWWKQNMVPVIDLFPQIWYNCFTYIL